MNVSPKLGQLMIYKTLLSKHIICLSFLINYIPGFAEMEQITKDVLYIKLKEDQTIFLDDCLEVLVCCKNSKRSYCHKSGRLLAHRNNGRRNTGEILQ